MWTPVASQTQTDKFKIRFVRNKMEKYKKEIGSWERQRREQ
jgi:hypothetical protein